MSHGVTIPMNGIKEREYLVEALKRMGEKVETGKGLVVHADDGDRRVEVRCPQGSEYAIGFYRSGGRYQAFADWFWVGKDQDEFIRRLEQEYQAAATVAQLRKSGLVGVISDHRNEETGQIFIEVEEAEIDRSLRVAAGGHDTPQSAVVEVGPDAEVTLTMVGYRGEACEIASRGVENKLGPVANRTWRPERWDDGDYLETVVEDT